MCRITLQWPAIIRNLPSFAKFKVTEEDSKKVSQYRAREKFRTDVAREPDLNSYLSSLDLRPTLVSLSSSNISRAEQMCAKTNQFNLRTKRYSARDLELLDNGENSRLFLVSFADVYGDHGLVALVCLKYFPHGLVFIDSFLMSCRVLGRHLEAWVLDAILKDAKALNKKYIIADFIDSGKNSIARNFLEDYKFEGIKKGSFDDDSLLVLNASVEVQAIF